MNNVLTLNAATIKCPVGSIATHALYGWCEVIAANGMQRTVQFEIRTPDKKLNLDDLPFGVEPEEVLFSETISTCEADVDVKELREARSSAPAYVYDEDRLVSLTNRRT
jgi:hypothetical protein